MYKTKKTNLMKNQLVKGKITHLIHHSIMSNQSLFKNLKFKYKNLL